MSKHTPGPWLAENSGGATYVVAQELLIASLAPVDLSGEFKDEFAEGEETQANARLIAAAPELLEQCQKALSAWTGEGPAILLDDLRAAIAKATGEQA